MDGVFSATEPLLVGCGEDYSFFFDLIDEEWQGVNVQPIHRICSLMRKLKVTHLCREELIIDGELRQDQEDLSVRIDRPVAFMAVRFSFFRTNETPNDWRALTSDQLLGYVVIATVNPSEGSSQSYIFESVVRPPTIWDVREAGAPVSNYYVHGQRPFRTTMGSGDDKRDLSLCGSFFCQQNGLTHVCAHAAIRTAINSSPSRSGKKVTVKEINDLLDKDHRSSKNRVGRFGKEPFTIGLVPSQIAHVARAFGFNPHVADFTLHPMVDYDEFIYPMVESGFPTILGLNPERVAHVVAVVGHTLNSDRWLPDARQGYNTVPYTNYASAAAWADHFIVSDDNLGALVTLPTESVRNILIPKYNAGLHASVALGLVPTDVTTTGYTVEKSNAAALIRMSKRYAPPPGTDANRWTKRLGKVPHTIPLVCRTTLQNRADYVQSLTEALDEKGNRLDAERLEQIGKLLDRSKFWVTEFTLPSLYTGNKRKLGEAVRIANATPDQIQKADGFLFAWLPGILRYGSSLENADYRWPLAGHVPLMRSSLMPTSALEW